MLPGRHFCQQEEAPQTMNPLRKEALSRNAKTSLESPSQGSSVYPENNGPSLLCSLKPSPVLAHEMPGKGAQRPGGS